MKRAWPVLLASLLGYIVIESLVFRSGLYARYTAPTSTTGQMEAILENELARPKEHPNQILAVGDSRMALIPRIANQLTPETGYTFATISLAGTTPRVWYYMLREVDPTADRYRAIVIGVDDYDDQENIENHNLRESDLNYLLSRLRLSDLVEFAASYEQPSFQWRAARGILFKGSVYQRDFQDFLLAPEARIAAAEQAHEYSHEWIYDYIAPQQNLTGLQIKWDTKTLVYPPQADPGLVPMMRQILLDPLPDDVGRRSAYLKKWLTRIADHYRGSQTKLVFVRLPRAPWIRPDLPPAKPNSVIRTLAQRDNVKFLAEDRFNFLETPEFFRDPKHLNQAGLDQFTMIAARDVGEMLGPAR